MGAKTTYTEAVAEKIIEQLSDGIFLRVICRQPGMPSWRTVYDWIDANPDFATRIARARDIGADAIAEGAVEIADTPMVGVTEKDSVNGLEITRADMLGHRKLQVETRIKMLAKWAPKKYGDKQTLEHTGPDQGPIQITDKAAAMAKLLAQAAERKAKTDDDVADLV